jgi:hypothetical protein
MSSLDLLSNTLLATARDIVPILSTVLFFQIAILRRPFRNPRQLLFGFVCVLLGLTIFLIGLEVALFPLGSAMAQQLAAPEFLDGSSVNLTGENIPQARPWYAYYWVYVFAFTIGISTTVAEPALIAVASKASEISGGTIKETELRLVVALGVGIGVAVGTFRIIVGYPLPMFILPGYLLVIIQTAFAPKSIIPIAYDSGGVTTSTVTVPIVAALGLGLATQVEGADPLIDGFGLIAFASLFPIMTVMGYAQISEWRNRPTASAPTATEPAAMIPPSQPPTTTAE